MPSDHAAPIRAAMLTATLSFEPRPVDPFALRVPVIRRVMPRIDPPLDLDAPIYRYRIDVDGKVSVRHDPVGARACTAPAPRSAMQSCGSRTRRTEGGRRRG